MQFQGGGAVDFSLGITAFNDQYKNSSADGIKIIDLSENDEFIFWKNIDIEEYIGDCVNKDGGIE